MALLMLPNVPVPPDQVTPLVWLAEPFREATPVVQIVEPEPALTIGPGTTVMVVLTQPAEPQMVVQRAE